MAKLILNPEPANNPAPIEIKVPSYYLYHGNPVAIGKESIIKVFDLFINCEETTYKSVKALNRDYMKEITAEEFFRLFDERAAELKRRVQSSIFEELKNDEEGHYEDEMRRQQEEGEQYYFELENPNFYE